ncbi:TPA: EAL domain-containing protein [Salmonella enterica subsp. houtenae]|nr:EAL domain-containing protein [Salmonella enterica subsp. houtenae]
MSDPLLASGLHSFSVSHILSACPFATSGLDILVGGVSCWRINPHTELDDYIYLDDVTVIRSMIVFIPDDPYWLLATLRRMVMLLNMSKSHIPVLILSHCSASWLWNTLRKLVTDLDQLTSVTSASAVLPYEQLSSLISAGVKVEHRLEKQADKEEKTLGYCPKGMTIKELEVVMDLLKGCSVRNQSMARNISRKTLYNQRRTGLRKLKEQYPFLNIFFHDTKQKKHSEKRHLSFSLFEKEFLQGIQNGLVFPLFQPIVDCDFRVQGFEILSRWRKGGQELAPGMFLPNIRSRLLWLQLTEFILHAAINQIQRRKDNTYFSINIPSEILGDSDFLYMLSSVRQQLNHKNQFKRLALEIAETTILTNDIKMRQSILELKKLGFRVMLDDCFSEGSVMFPVRVAHFIDYKLDLNIVHDAQHDEYVCALIKSLTYYCSLTGSCCIAEGVDSLKKFRLLKDMGVQYFQGYIISPPLTEDELGSISNRLQYLKNCLDISRTSDAEDIFLED